MAGAFQYKPKFVDIRVRPPGSEEEAKRNDDVYALKPGERACDHPGCRHDSPCRQGLPHEVKVGRPRGVSP